MSSMLCLEIPLVSLMLYHDARQCAVVCSVAASAWFLCSVLSVPVTILSGDPISIPDVIHMSQMLYAGQSDREDVTFFSDF